MVCNFFFYYTEQNKEDKTDKDDKRPESAAIRSRRIRRERRSTGITNYTPEVSLMLMESLLMQKVIIRFISVLN